MKILTGCLAIIGTAFIALVIAAMVLPSNRGASSPARSTSVAGSSYRGNPCRDAADASIGAASLLRNDRYGHAFERAEQGLKANERCGDEAQRLMNRAYLMTMKAYAEHGLSDRSWRTDLNEANALLEECITRPGLYATHAGAACQTQQHDNIAAQLRWEQ